MGTRTESRDPACGQILELQQTQAENYDMDKEKTYVYTSNQTRLLVNFVLVLPIDIENPYRLSNCLYRYISIYIGFLATNL